ncbi:MAG: hypothetical protein M1834_003952 [Cirrosporium novae-zelandiae]|nr:MAG: hypothetical protein M1834_003952 [Cirrosporium novae-zelandiae]
MMRREDSTTTANSKSAAAGSTADSSIATKTAAKTTATGKAASTSDSKSASGTNKSASKTGTATGKSKTKTGTGTDSDTKTGTSTGTGSSNSSTTYTGVTGGVSLLTPASTTTTYFKIGDYVTFVWNYTSLSVTPSGIDVMATCSINSEMYTLTRNMSVDPTGHFTWDTGKYQSTATVPLLVETYTLVIMDAKLDISATASAGHLSVYDTWTFGMYTPQAYTPLNGMYNSIYLKLASTNHRQHSNAQPVAELSPKRNGTSST